MTSLKSKPSNERISRIYTCRRAAVVIIEEYEQAKNRKPKFMQEIIGEHINCGGQQNGGNMTSSNFEKVKIV